MVISKYYYEILGVKPSANREEIKKVFRILVRKNHPDLFPEEEKELQELKMIQINEAYARLTETLSKDEEMEFRVWDEWDENVVVSKDKTGIRYPHPKNEVGFHRDVQYVHYKQGFIFYSKALNGIKRIERRVSLKNDIYYLRHFADSLVYLRKADMYFCKLLNDYPDSIWAYDASIKIKRIERFNMIYKRILNNIEKKLKNEYKLKPT
jgi:hypothetical protein